jgi:DNA (cytosine-5)-methyltransferase 1
MARRRKLKAIDLFAGCGGLSLGLRDAGFRVVLAIDADDLAAKTYKANHPKTVVVRDDITAVDPNILMRRLKLKKGDLDLLAGCPPCQGFSRMRTLNGARDGDEEKNNLVWMFLKFVLAFEPKTIMLENVPGLHKDFRLAKIKASLKDAGYSISDAVLNAADYGVPQSRRRLVLVGAKSFEPRLAEADEERLTVRSALSLIRPSGTTLDPLHDYQERRSPSVAQIIKAVPKNGGSRSDLPQELVLECHKNSDGFKDVYGRMSWDTPAPTITGGCINPSKGRFLHPEQDRAITLREAALLQGFPPNYVFDLSRGRFPAAQMIGNAFPPAFAQRHAKLLAMRLQTKND